MNINALNDALTAPTRAVVKPDSYPAEVMGAAYEAYIGGNFDYETMSLELSVPVKVIKRWVDEGKWRDRKMEIDRALFEEAEIEYKKFVTKNRTPVAERHARIAGELEKALEKQLEIVRDEIANGTLDERSPGSTLKRLAEALASVTGVSARAVGMSDKVTVFEAEQGAKSKQPLVVINTVPQVSREPRDVTRDITVS